MSLKFGVWHRLLAEVAEGGASLGIVHLGGTKVCAGSGRSRRFFLAPGRSYELQNAEPPLDMLPGVPLYGVCDRECSSEKSRDAVWSMGRCPVVPTER